jgi:hypothetical protein
MAPYFFGGRAHIPLFLGNKCFGTHRTNGGVPRRLIVVYYESIKRELEKDVYMSVGVDVWTTLAGSSDENIGLMSGMSARSWTVLVLVVIGKSDPLCFSQS